jgi:hypothetical protein
MTAVLRPIVRDRSACVEFTQEEVLRHVYLRTAERAMSFLFCSLAKKWQSSSQMITGEIEQRSQRELAIHHPRLFFSSCPWEWSIAQWQATFSPHFTGVRERHFPNSRTLFLVEKR